MTKDHNTEQAVSELIVDLRDLVDLTTWQQEVVNRAISALSQVRGKAQEPVATVRVRHKGYSVELSTYVAYALPEGLHDLYAAAPQVNAIANHASESVKTAIWIAIYTGMRRGEILKLEKAHISKDLITIPAGNTKTLKMRSVPIIDQLRPWLERIPLEINFEGLKSGFRRAREAAGMPHVHFHDLRHSTASLLAHAGVDLHTISKILGHSTTRMSERYAHIKVDKQRGALEKVFGGR